jgi:mannose-1-phosphate guanylyltransferase
VSHVHHALILAAGLGTRLQPLTSIRAKPAIPLAGEPLVRRIARSLAASDVTELVVNLHHLPATLTAVLGDGADLGVRVRYSWEQPIVLGSAGGPRQALPIIGAGSFFIVNGDTLSDVNLSELAAEHARSGALVTLALVPNREPQRYGGVLLDDRSRAIGFARRGPAATGSFHFVGVQIVEADVFRPVPAGRPVSSIGDVYDKLLESRPGSVRGFVCDAAFWDIGTVADYLRTSRAFADDGAAPPEPAARIDPTARVARSILWNDIEVGPNADIDECILTDGVSVPKGAIWRQMILMRGTDGRLMTSPLAG